MLQLLLSMMLLLCGSDSLNAVNIAANKVVYTSTLVQGTAPSITDTIKQNPPCAMTGIDSPYIVIDLGVTVKISSIILWSTAEDVASLVGYNILAMNDWRSCHNDSFFSGDNVNCGTINNGDTLGQLKLDVKVACNGRFVALVTPKSPQQPVTVCEMEIYGTNPQPSIGAIFQNPYERQCGVNNNAYLSLNLAKGKLSDGSALAGTEEESSITYATDGLEYFNYQCYSTNGKSNYFVLDLGEEVDISFVRIQSTYWDNENLALYDASISNHWTACNSLQRFTQPLCVGVIVQDAPNDLWELKTNGKCIGRYFILRAKDATEFQWLKICEIEVYGTATKNSIIETNTFENECSLSSTVENVALGKTAVASYDSNLNMITDGILDQFNIWNTCFYSYWAETNFVVIDLGAPYNLDAIKVWNSRSGDGGNQYTIDISVGLSFRMQYAAEDTSKFQIIGAGLPVSDWFTILKLNKDVPVIGQFIMITKQNNYIDTLVICEVEVVGIRMNDMPIMNQRPIVNDEAIQNIGQSNFPIMSALRDKVSYMFHSQYSGFVISTEPSYEGILWFPSANLPYALAGKYGLGNFVAIGKANYFKNFLNTKCDPRFKVNLYTFLSPQKGLNARIISSTKIDSSNSGDIVYFDIASLLTPAQQKKILSDLYSGKVSLVIEMTYWAELSYSTNANVYDFLLKALNIFFSPLYAGDTDEQIPISDSDFQSYNYNNLYTKLSLFGQNQPYLQTYGFDVVSTLTDSPDYLITDKVLSNLKAIVDKYWDLVTYICPGVLTPMQKGADEMLLLVFNAILNLQSMSKYSLKAPCVDIFPGDIPSSVSAILSVSTMKVIAQVEYESHATGLYLAPGQTLFYNTNSIVGQWAIAIGCHTDKLYYEPDLSFYHWFRYPNIHSGYYPINNNNGTIYSPFGGVVWLQNIDNTGSLDITIRGAVKSRYFNIRDNAADDLWQERIDAPGLWVEIMGQNIIITAPRNILLEISAADLRQTIDTWDRIVALQNVLGGTRANENRRERVVIDTQIYIGSGHSGYPIMVTYPWITSVFNYSIISSLGSWGLTHEFGHQRQQGYFTFTGTEEVTVNIFADFIWNYVWKINFFSGNHLRFQDSTKQNIINYFSDGAQFSDWQKQYDLAYVIYGQLGYHFGFGLYQQVFTYYRNENPSLADDQAIIDLWVLTLSNYSNYNLVSLFDFWGIPVSDQVRATTGNMPCFLPLDPATDLVPDRLSDIASKYNHECVTTPSKTMEVVIPDDLVIELPNDITIT